MKQNKEQAKFDEGNVFVVLNLPDRVDYHDFAAKDSISNVYEYFKIPQQFWSLLRIKQQKKTDAPSKLLGSYREKMLTIVFDTDKK